MSLIGKYINKDTGDRLDIKTANDANGKLSGTLTSNGRTMNVEGHFHFLNNSESPTSIAFWAAADNPNLYEAWSGTGDRDSDFDELMMQGIRSTLSGEGRSLCTLGGPFVRM